MFVMQGAFAIGQGAQPIQMIAAALPQAEDLLEIIMRPSAIDSFATTGTTLPSVVGDVEVKDVVFAYPSAPDHMVCNGYSLSVKAGQTVALSDVWTNFAAVVCVQERPSIIRTNAFGYQFRFMSEAMNVQVIPWLLPGVAGGEYCKVTHSTDTFVTSNVSGYLWATVLA